VALRQDISVNKPRPSILNKPTCRGRDDRTHEARERKCRIDCALRYGLDFAHGASKIRLTRGLSAFGLFPKRRTDFASRGRSMHPPRGSVVANCGRSGDLSSFGPSCSLLNTWKATVDCGNGLKPKGYGNDAHCNATVAGTIVKLVSKHCALRMSPVRNAHHQNGMVPSLMEYPTSSAFYASRASQESEPCVLLPYGLSTDWNHRHQSATCIMRSCLRGMLIEFIALGRATPID